jgi:hypothetical protein
MTARANLTLAACILAASPQARAAGSLPHSGSQIVDGGGHPVRLACTGYFEMVTTISQDLKGLVADSFNCLRFPWVVRPNYTEG